MRRYDARMTRRRILAFLACLLAAISLRFACGHAEPAAKDPRLVLGRVWLDRLPNGPRDDRELWVFLAGGIGIHEKGSWFRSTIEIFDFERQGGSLAITFLHDKSKARTKFTVASCDDKPPFKLCLMLDDPPRGPKKLYSFDDDDEMDRAMPWGKDELKLAEAKARSR